MSQELYAQLVDACELYCMMNKYDTAINRLKQNIEYYEEQKKKIKKVGFRATPGVLIIVFTLIPICFTCAISACYISEAFGLLATLLLCFVPPVAALLYKFIICRSITKKRRKKAEEKYNKEMEPLRREDQKNIYSLQRERGDFWRKNSHLLDFMPECYRSNLAVAFMERVIKTGRADNLKEAINLFEEQLHRWTLEGQAQRMVEQNAIQNAILDDRLYEITRNQNRIASSLQSIENLEFYNTFCR